MNILNVVRSVMQMATLDSTAAAILSHTSTHKNLRKTVTVDRLVDLCGKRTSRKAVLKVLRQFETHGFGKLIVGRHGRKSRFEWAVV